MEKTIFITGATGFVGGNFAAHLLHTFPEARLTLLVRGSSSRQARERMLAHLRMIDPGAAAEGIEDRIEVLRGDITADHLGLTDDEYRRVAQSATHIVHCAATVEFTLPLEQARAINLGGTREVFRLAHAARESGRLSCVAYVGTAYVSGKRGGIIYEDELQAGAQFANSYEQSKFESEEYVRSEMQHLPVVIFRPSIIVGDSHTGRTTAFNVLYSPLRLISRGLVPALPGSRRTPLDIVPVDFVVEAISHILFKSGQPAGRTYHLTAGRDRASSAGEVVDLAVGHFAGHSEAESARRLLFLPMAVYRALRRLLRGRAQRACELIDIYESYLCVRRTFDNTNTRSALRDAQIAPPRFSDYCRAIFEYCIETNWGKRLSHAA